LPENLIVQPLVFRELAYNLFLLSKLGVWELFPNVKKIPIPQNGENPERLNPDFFGDFSVLEGLTQPILT
jgi:hypothetical protein